MIDIPLINQKTSLELFSGSQTITNFFKSKNWHCLSIDIDYKLCPSIVANILNIQREDLPQLVNFIWSSPECKALSRAAPQSNWSKQIIKYRIYDYKPLTESAFNAIKYIEKTIDIISWFPGIPFVIENPIGRIHHLSPLKNFGHYRYAVNYADFGFDYSKETYLFTNIMLPLSTKKVHSFKPGLRTIRQTYQKSIVPVDLIKMIYNYLW
jgi:hypothetical protein